MSGFSGSVDGQIDGPASERRLEREGHWVKSMCKKGFWVKSLWVKSIWVKSLCKKSSWVKSLWVKSLSEKYVQ